MIGVVAAAEHRWVVNEFFELFKTAWEWAVPGTKYRVVLSADGSIDALRADAFLIFGSMVHAVDRSSGTVVRPAEEPTATHRDVDIPIYGRAAVFDRDDGLLRCRAESLAYRTRIGKAAVIRIGYDLFEEVELLLTRGQPKSWSATPTLEHHIDILRQLLLACGITFAEIPPKPADYAFLCCLTHDIDFLGIRRHFFDRTLAGFAWRASLGTLIDVARGRRPPLDAVRNWLALASLPLVWLRLAPDFWRPFEDYSAVESGRKATFFLVPFKNRPGIAPDGAVDGIRGVPYQISEIVGDLRGLIAHDAEAAIHGIDAWRDVDAGREELATLTAVTDQPVVGVRMHWLYFDAASPQRLEAAGFAYDSTWGYNDAIGYRAGTPQVFRPLGASTLLELPMTIMDSALFYSRRMSLRPAQAAQMCDGIVANARRFGGVVVVNWHDRSLAPERLWGDSYRRLLGEIEKGSQIWFATAAEAVAWFRWRRSIRIDSDAAGAAAVHGPLPPSGMPAAEVVVRRPDRVGHGNETRRFDGSSVLRLAM